MQIPPPRLNHARARGRRADGRCGDGRGWERGAVYGDTLSDKGGRDADTLLSWFTTVCTPGAGVVVGVQTEVEDFESAFFEVDEAFQVDRDVIARGRGARTRDITPRPR